MTRWRMRAETTVDDGNPHVWEKDGETPRDAALAFCEQDTSPPFKHFFAALVQDWASLNGAEESGDGGSFEFEYEEGGRYRVEVSLYEVQGDLA